MTVPPIIDDESRRQLKDRWGLSEAVIRELEQLILVIKEWRSTFVVQPSMEDRNRVLNEIMIHVLGLAKALHDVQMFQFHTEATVDLKDLLKASADPNDVFPLCPEITDYDIFSGRTVKCKLRHLFIMLGQQLIGIARGIKIFLDNESAIGTPGRHPVEISWHLA